MSMSTCVSDNHTTPLILRLIHESTGIVNVAGSIVRKVLRSGNLDIVDKGINDLQTKADRAAQIYITTELSKKFPLATIIGEEGDDIQENLDDLLSPVGVDTTRIHDNLLTFSDILTKNVTGGLNNLQESELVIWIDPLDGTSEFTKGLVGHVTILIGVAYNGVPIGGVIHEPFLEVGNHIGRTLWGIPGVGYGGFTFQPPPTDRRIITTTRSHSSPKVEAALASLQPDEVLREGGAGHKVVLLIDGKAHAYVYASAGCKKWDTCACEAVLKAIGGELTDMKGKSYKYSKDVEHLNEGGTIATAPGENHLWFVNQIPA